MTESIHGEPGAFQCQSLQLTAASEEEPFKERYEARGYLEICVAMTAGQDPKALLTKALCHHKIGLINYEVEEI